MKSKTNGVHLELIGNGRGDFCGVVGVPNRLPTIHRWPGETPDQFKTRVLHAVEGSGRLWARLMYPGQSAKGTPTALVHQGYSNPVKNSVGEFLSL